MLNFMNNDAPPSPLQHGWTLIEGKCLPVRYTKPALPQRLTHVRTTDDTSDTDSDSDSDSASDGYETEYE